MISQNTTIKNALPSQAQDLINQTTMFNNMAMDYNDNLFKPCLGQVASVTGLGDVMEVATDVLDGVKEFSAGLSKVLNTELDDIVCDVAKMDTDALLGRLPELPSFDFSSGAKVDEESESEELTPEELQANGLRQAQVKIPINKIAQFNIVEIYPDDKRNEYLAEDPKPGQRFKDRLDEYLFGESCLFEPDENEEYQVDVPLVLESVSLNELSTINDDNTISSGFTASFTPNILKISRGKTGVCYKTATDDSLQLSDGKNELDNITSGINNNILQFKVDKKTVYNQLSKKHNVYQFTYQGTLSDIKVYDIPNTELTQLNSAFTKNGIDLSKQSNICLSYAVAITGREFKTSYIASNGVSHYAGDYDITKVELCLQNITYNYNYIGAKASIGEMAIGGVTSAMTSATNFAKNISISRLKSTIMTSSLGKSIIDDNIKKFSASIPGMDLIDSGEITDLVSGELSRNAISCINDGEISLDGEFTKSLANSVTNSSINGALAKAGVPIALDNECTRAIIDEIAEQMPSIELSTNVFSFGEEDDVIPLDTSTIFAKASLDDINKKFTEIIDSDCMRAINTNFDIIDSNILETGLSIKGMYESDSLSLRDSISSAKQLGDGAKAALLDELNGVLP